MSLYKPTGSKTWVYDFVFQGQRVRQHTGTRSRSLAQKIERKRRTELEEGAAGIRKKRNPARLFSVAVEEFLENKAVEWQPKTLAMAENSKAHLWPAFGQRLLVDIAPEDIPTTRNNAPQRERHHGRSTSKSRCCAGSWVRCGRGSGRMTTTR